MYENLVKVTIKLSRATDLEGTEGAWFARAVEVETEGNVHPDRDTVVRHAKADALCAIADGLRGHYDGDPDFRGLVFEVEGEALTSDDFKTQKLYDTQETVITEKMSEPEGNVVKVTIDIEQWKDRDGNPRSDAWDALATEVPDVGGATFSPRGSAIRLAKASVLERILEQLKYGGPEDEGIGGVVFETREKSDE